MTPTPDMTHPLSTNVRCFGYDVDSGELWVAYKNTPGFYVYVNVPAVVHQGLLAAESKGRFLHEHVLSVYEERQEDR